MKIDPHECRNSYVLNCFIISVKYFYCLTWINLTVESNQWSVIRTLSVAFRDSISGVTIETCTRVWPWGVGTFSSRMTLVSGSTCTLIYVFKIKYTTNIITESLNERERERERERESKTKDIIKNVHNSWIFWIQAIPIFANISMIFVILFPDGCSIWCSKLPSLKHGNVVHFPAIFIHFHHSIKEKHTVTVQSTSVVTFWTCAGVGAKCVCTRSNFVTEVAFTRGTFVHIFTNTKTNLDTAVG